MASRKKTNSIVAAMKEIGVRRIAFLVFAGIVSAVFALMLAVNGLTRLRNPSVALALFPNDSVALGAQAEQLALAKPTDPPLEVRALAIAALRNQAINPRALRVLGGYAEVRSTLAEAEQLILMAQRLSRRESGAQMWLVEANARRNDTKQTLVHYDVALRVRPDNSLILFPRLAAAIEDAEIRAALKPYIRAKNGWGERFIADALNLNTNLPALAAVMIDSGGIPDPRANRELQTTLIGRLVDGGYYQDARRLFLTMRGASAKRLTSTAFDPVDRTGIHGPIGWQMIEEADGGGGFTGAAEQGDLALEIFTNADNTRPVARKLLYLAAGNYNFAVDVARLQTDPGGYLRWQLRCMRGVGADKPLIWSVQGVERNIRSTVAIPAACPVQMLELVAAGGQGQSGIEATIRSVKIAPQN